MQKVFILKQNNLAFKIFIYYNNIEVHNTNKSFVL